MKRFLSVIAAVALSIGSLVGVSTAAVATPVYTVTATSSSLAEGESTTLATDAPEDAVVAVFVDGVLSGELSTAAALNNATYAWGWGVTDTSIEHTVSFRIYEPGTAEITADTVAWAAVDVTYAAQAEELGDDAPILARGAAPANYTNWDNVCGWDSGDTIDIETATVDFFDVCLTSGEISDADTANKGDAYDEFGFVRTTDIGSAVAELGSDPIISYIFTADTEPVVTDSSVTFVDEDVWSSTEEAYVDVTVQRLFSNNWVTWSVTVVLADTDTPAEIDITIGGNLGSDSWTRVADLGNGGTLTDDGDAMWDPSLLWVSEGTFAQTGDYGDDIEFSFGATSSASLTNGLIDYEYCVEREAVDAYAQEVFAAYATTYNTALETVEGECSFTFDAASFSFAVGEEVDEIFALSFTGFDFTDIGYWSDVWNVPAGLDYEIIEDGSGAPVALRLFGVPTEAFADDVFVEIGEQNYLGRSIDYDARATEKLPGTVKQVVSLSQDFQAKIGEVVAGTGVDYSALGLEAGSDWTQTVQSSPQIIANGVAGDLGAISGAGVIPSGLEAGWHTVTLAGKSYLGESVKNVLWFELDAGGRLLQIRNSAPVQEGTLAKTGANDAGIGGAALGLLALLGAGAALTIAGRRRSAVQ